jgi:P4 family phage/plasmid primase-like protien
MSTEHLYAEKITGHEDIEEEFGARGAKIKTLPPKPKTERQVLEQEPKTEKQVLERLNEDAEVYLDDPARWSIEILPIALAAGIGQTRYEKLTAAAAKIIKRQRKEAEKRRREDERAKKVAEAASVGVPSFSLGDNAEVAQKLCESYAKDSTDPPAFDLGTFYAYHQGSGLWEPISDARLIERLCSWSGRAWVGSGDGMKPFRLNSTDQIIKMAKALPIRWGQHEGFFAAAPKGIAFRNGFVAVVPRDGKWVLERRPAGRENRARVGFGFDYNPAAEAPMFRRMLEQMFEGAEDPQQRHDLLQEHLGACLMGVAPQFQKALVLYGQGGCGKGTLLKIISAAFPAGSVKAAQPHEWGRGVTLADLASARINIVNEMSTDDLYDINAVKRVVVGDLVRGEAKFSAPFEYAPEFGHIFTANTDMLPPVPRADSAFWDRWHIVPMDNRFRGTSEENRTLAQEIIEQELPGVVRWMLEGARRLFEQNRYTVCPTGERELKTWKGFSSIPMLFIEECTSRLVEVDKKNALPLVDDVYAAYRDFAKVWGFQNYGSQDAFTRALRKEKLITDSGGRRVMVRMLPVVNEYASKANRGYGS